VSDKIPYDQLERDFLNFGDEITRLTEMLASAHKQLAAAQAYYPKWVAIYQHQIKVIAAAVSETEQRGLHLEALREYYGVAEDQLQKILMSPNQTSEPPKGEK
jgi:hypothetical protein